MKLDALRKLVEEWAPKPNALMDYQGSSHGYTAEAASNRKLKMCANELSAVILEIEAQITAERELALPQDVREALSNTAAAMNMTQEQLLERIIRERLMPRVHKD